MYLGKHRGSFKSYSAEKSDILVMPCLCYKVSLFRTEFCHLETFPYYAPDSSGAFLVTVKVVLWCNRLCAVNFTYMTSVSI